MDKYTTIDEYIAQFPDDIRKILEKTRKVIRKAAPKAEERIRWQMPTFWQGENLIHFAAMKHHLGIYPGEAGIRAFAERFDAEGYKYTKGAVQLPFSKPIPYDLIREIAEFRVGQVTESR